MFTTTYVYNFTKLDCVSRQQLFKLNSLEVDIWRLCLGQV